MANSSSVRHSYRVEPVWDGLPEHTNTLLGVSRDECRLRFRREKNSHRGLREFENLKELVIFCPNQEAISEIGHLQNLESLYIDETRAKDLSPLTNCKSLRYLTIKGATQATGLEWIRDLPPIDSLLLENCKKLTDFSPIASLKQLKALGIEGSMWTTQKIDSFSPIAELGSIEALFIMNCRPSSDGLVPLHDLHSLRFLEAPAFYTEVEFLALQDAIPELACEWFDLIKESGSIKAAINAAVAKME